MIASRFKTGNKTRISPYFAIENFNDWMVDLQGGITFISSGKESWRDKRNNPTVASFISRPEEKDNFESAVNMSAWDARYTNFKVCFSPDAKMIDWIDNPVLTFAYDHPWDLEIKHTGKEAYESPNYRFTASLTFKV